MLSKARLKVLQALKHKKYRQKYQLFLVEGHKSIISSLESKRFSFDHLYCTADWWKMNQAAVTPYKVPMEITESRMLAKISQLKTAPEVIASVQFPKNPLSIDNLATNISILYLDGVQDPGNVGTLIRLADWFGIGAVVASQDTADFYSSKVIQSSMGSFAHVPLVRTDPQSLCAQFPNHQCIVADMYGSSPKSITVESPTILVLGNEGNGPSTFFNTYAKTEKVCIPRASNSHAESLNVATAASILLYEFFGG